MGLPIPAQLTPVKQRMGLLPRQQNHRRRRQCIEVATGIGSPGLNLLAGGIAAFPHGGGLHQGRIFIITGINPAG